MNRLIFCVVIIVLLISCSKDVAPLVPPAAPSDLKTVLYPNEVGVEWTVNSTTELGFNVERKTGASDYTLLHTVLTNAFHSGGYPDYDVLPGTTYSYRVNAYNSAGISAYSNETSVITPGLPTLTTSAVSAITSTTASSGGNVTSDGGSQIRARGIA